jgi:hypothetical protein
LYVFVNQNGLNETKTKPVSVRMKKERKDVVVVLLKIACVKKKQRQDFSLRRDYQQ